MLWSQPDGVFRPTRSGPRLNRGAFPAPARHKNYINPTYLTHARILHYSVEPPFGQGGQYACSGPENGVVILFADFCIINIAVERVPTLFQGEDT